MILYALHYVNLIKAPTQIVRRAFSSSTPATTTTTKWPRPHRRFGRIKTFPRCWTALRKVWENHGGLRCAMLRPGSGTSSYKTPIVRNDKRCLGACCQAEHTKAICFGCWGLVGFLATNVEKSPNRLFKWCRPCCVVVHRIATVCIYV